jgi:hypothetical protein
MRQSVEAEAKFSDCPGLPGTEAEEIPSPGVAKRHHSRRHPAIAPASLAVSKATLVESDPPAGPRPFSIDAQERFYG